MYYNKFNTMSTDCNPFQKLGCAIARQAALDYKKAIKNAIKIMDALSCMQKNDEILYEKHQLMQEISDLREWFLGGTFEMFTNLPGEITVIEIEKQYPDINIIEFIEGK